MEKRCPIQHYWWRILFALVLTCSVGVQSVNNQTRTATKSAATPQPSPQASPVAAPATSTIAIPQVATEAIQLNQRLRNLPERLVSDESLAEIEQQLERLKETTSEKAGETELAIQSGAILAELRQSSQDWQALSKEVEGLSETLTRQATALQNEIQSLKSDESVWLATNEEIKTQEAPPPELLELTSKAVADINAALKLAEERRGRIVALQQSVATQSSVIATELGHVKKAMAESQRSLLDPDSLPLWKVQFSSEAQTTVARLLRGSYAEDLARVKTYVRAKRTALVVIVVLTLVVLVFLLRLSSTSKTIESDLEKPESILHRPFSFSLLALLVAMMPMLYDAPVGVVGLVNLVGIIPVVRLLKPRLSIPSGRMLIALIASVLVSHLIKFVQSPVWVKRDLLAVFTLGVVALFGWLAREARRRDVNQQQGPTLLLVGTYVGIVLLLLALFANLFGYVRLSDLLTQGTLVSAYRAVALYTVVVIGTLLISFTLQAKSTQRLAIFRVGADRVSRRLSFALGVIMLLLWVHTALNLFAIREDVYAAIRTALNYQIKIGSASLEISNIVAFVLTIFFGYLVATVIRAILGDEILPRLNLARGLPNAIATVTHYVVMVLVFLLALAAGGVELSKFTILTGAIGVGLGFGLQNIVNNFVSGLILLFERPVRVGDFLEIGGVGGQVTKIGFRSSTLHAADGSDVIIPNANLISQQVINWTLTGTRRQILLNIHVAYNTDPNYVRELLRSTVASHPDVLDFPKPAALFLGFGDNALNFEVRFWAPRPEVVPELRSDVALSIAAALNEAGIKVPVPQADLHIISSDENVKGAVTTSSKDGG